MVYLLFFLSGVAGLAYEIAWGRMFGTLLGNTAYAAMAVLAAYFAGMALGYWLGGRIAARIHYALRAYGYAELLVAGGALLVPLALSWAATPQLARLLAFESPLLQVLVRTGFALVVMLPATAALGATLPLVARHVSPLPDGVRRIAWAYSANTAGAVTGVALATFVLIPQLGVSACALFAICLSTLTGLAAILLKGRPVGLLVQVARRRPVKATWLVLAALSGLGVIALEVMYTRMLALVLHNSTYSFGVLLAVTLAALAGASALAAKLSRRYSPLTLAGWGLAGGGVLATIAPVAFQRITGLEYFTPAADILGYTAAVLGLAAITAGPPLLLLGMVLPSCYLALQGSQADTAQASGMLTAVNAICAALGSLLAGLLLLPALGLWAGILLLALLFTTAGLAALTRRMKLPALAVTALAALALCAIAGWQATQPPWPLGRAETLAYERETPYGLINVTRDGRGDLWLRQDYHYTLGSNSGSQSETRQAHLPLLLHPQPEQVLLLGLATGITASGALQHPEVEQATAVELIPEVAEAAELFADYNKRFGSTPRSAVAINDARHYLYASPQSYDVIISDLFTPWHSQTGYLYTVEHYRAAREHLADGGLFCQWLPLYQLGPRELEYIANSFASVFPYATVWRGEVYSSTSPLLALIGSVEPLTVDGARLQERLAGMEWAWYGADPDLQQPPDLLGLYVGRWPAPGEGALLNTDDRPRVEFSAPLSQLELNKLTGDALRDYYQQRLLSLPLAGLEYTPRAGEPAPPLDAGRIQQYRALAARQ